jgi:DNA-binding GntR family transcriptional regulator
MPLASTPPATRRSRGMALVKRETLKEQIYVEARRALQAGKFEPGEAITVKLLADELGAGTMPIREALHRLVAEGALVSLPSGRVRVPLFTAEEFDELKEIRLRLEGMAANLAASRAGRDGMATIEERYAALHAAVSKPSDWVEIIHTNYRFHFAIYQAAQTRHLISLIDSLWLRVSPLLSIPFKSRPKARGEYLLIHDDNHARLMAALRAGSGYAAEAEIRGIILASAAWYHRHHRFATNLGDRIAQR